MFDGEYELYLKIKELFPTNSVYMGGIKDFDSIPDTSIFVREYGGNSLREFSTRKQFDRINIQCLIRGEQQNLSSAKILAKSIYNQLQSTSWTASTLEIIQDIEALQRPIFLNTDSKNRYLYSINFQMKVYIDLDS